MTIALWILIASNWLLIAWVAIWLFFFRRHVLNILADEIRKQDDRIRKRNTRDPAGTEPGPPSEEPGQLPAGQYPPQDLVAGQSLRRN